MPAFKREHAGLYTISGPKWHAQAIVRKDGVWKLSPVLPDGQVRPTMFDLWFTTLKAAQDYVRLVDTEAEE